VAAFLGGLCSETARYRVSPVTCETCGAIGRIIGDGIAWVPEATVKCRQLSAADRTSWAMILSRCPSMAKAIALAVEKDAGAWKHIDRR
jgi:hypothetical protein